MLGLPAPYRTPGNTASQYSLLTAHRKAVRFIYSPLEGRTAHLQSIGRPYSPFTARWKAVRFILRTISRTHSQLGAPFGRQPRRHLRRNFLCISFAFYGFISYIFYIFYIL